MTEAAGGASNPPVVSVIVVSYNTRAMTLACLRSVADQTTVPYELIVVDNASGDGSADAIGECAPGAMLLAEPTNHGFAAANNIAARAASAPRLLLLNPDTVVLDGAIDRLVEFAGLTPTNGIWGGKTLFGDGSLNPSSCWRRMTLWSLLCRVLGLDRRFANSAVFNSEAYGGWERDTERHVDIVSGCFLLIDTELWNRLGGFDERYVMYGEEADLCDRARRRGCRPAITPTAEIVHYGGASERVRSDKHVRLLRAKITLVERGFPRWQRPLARALLRSWPRSRALAERLVGRVMRRNSTPDTDWRRVWADRAVWWNGYPGVESDRVVADGRSRWTAS